MRWVFCLLLPLLLHGPLTSCVVFDDPWLTIAPTSEGLGSGKHVVLISGDEEYRSEEALPQLAKILARHGFRCTVLFAIDPKDGTINPNIRDNIPGTEALKTADLMVIFTRYRDLPDEQMKPIADYVNAGKPIIGMRTATHAFNMDSKKQRSYLQFSSNGKQWKGGFGKEVLGETWVAHHGHHGKEGTRGIIVQDEANHPILQGIVDGDIFGPTDVYTVTLPLKGCTPLVMGEVTSTLEANSPRVEGKKNTPMMPVAWTRTYKSASGKEARIFTTTLGASQDLEYEGTRRMLVNACFWAVGLEGKIPAKTDVALVGDYQTRPFKFNGHKPGVKPSDLK
jgi:type 1 glutamine amidotransferase